MSQKLVGFGDLSRFEHDINKGIAGELMHHYNDGEIIQPYLLSLKERDFEDIEVEIAPIAGIQKTFKMPKSRMLDMFKHFEGEYRDWLKLQEKAHRSGKMFNFGAKSTSDGTWPVSLDPQLLDWTLTEAPFYGMMQKVASKTKTVDYDIVSAKTAAGFKAEGAALTLASDTVTGKQRTIKFAYASGGVSGPAQVLNKGYDFMQSEIALRSQALIEAIDKIWLRGYAIATTAANTYLCYFDTYYAQRGLYGDLALCSGNATSHATGVNIVLSNISGGSGIIASIDTDKSPQANRCIITDSTTHARIKMLVTAYQRSAPMMTLPWGAKALELDGIPVIWDNNGPTTAIHRAIAVAQMGVLETRVALDITKFDIADTVDQDSFSMKAYLCFVNKAPLWHAARLEMP